MTFLLLTKLQRIRIMKYVASRSATFAPHQPNHESLPSSLPRVAQSYVTYVTAVVWFDHFQSFVFFSPMKLTDAGLYVRSVQIFYYPQHKLGLSCIGHFFKALFLRVAFIVFELLDFRNLNRKRVLCVVYETKCVNYVLTFA